MDCRTVHLVRWCGCRKRYCAVWGALAAISLVVVAGCSSISAQGKNAEGVRLFQQARFPEAMRMFQEAVYDDPNNADGYYNLAATYHRTGRLENRPSDLELAERLYNQCLDHDANYVDCYRGLAVLLMEQGRRDEAFRLIEGWGDRQPGKPDPKIELARVYDELGEQQAAKEHLLEALAIDSNNPRALTALGKVREELGDRPQALAAYQRSLAADNRQADVAARIAALQPAVAPVYPTMAAAYPAPAMAYPAPYPAPATYPYPYATPAAPPDGRSLLGDRPAAPVR